MPRLMLTDESWNKLQPILLHLGIYNTENLRVIFEGILYRMRTGCPWRDIPSWFGKWETVYRRFHRWSAREIFQKIFLSQVQQPDLEWIFIDGTYVSAHQHASGAAHGQEAAIGISRGGNTSKIHMVVDAFGSPIRFIITGGEVHDCKVAPQLIQKKEEKADFTIADKGYDSEALPEKIREQGSTPIIPRKKNTTKQEDKNFDSYLYKLRHLVENAFARIKHFRAIATRYDKLKRNYANMVALACAFIRLPLYNSMD